MPENAKLTEWPKELPQWDTLSFEEKTLFIKQANVDPGLSGLHRPSGRPRHPGCRGSRRTRQHVNHLYQRRQWRERGRHAQRHAGRVHDVQWWSPSVKDQFLWYEFWIGSDLPGFPRRHGRGRSIPRSNGSSRLRRISAEPHRAWPMSWPGHINDAGNIRRQFHHIIDIVPTILEATGIPQPHDQRHRPTPDGWRQHDLYMGQGERRCPDPAHDEKIPRCWATGPSYPRGVGGVHHAGDPSHGN